MQEYHVTVAGQRHDLPRPFHVLATQNPLEQEGTYPLPEAQLDRFLMQIDVHYPDLASERQILLQTTGTARQTAHAVLDAAELMRMQQLVRHIPVGDAVVDAILTLVRACRPETGGPEIAEAVSWGPGPRAGQALMLTVRARALLSGRLAPSLDDVLALAEPVLKHRMALTFAARAEGKTLPTVIADIVRRIARA
jgi:MoxR-like ATPase